MYNQPENKRGKLERDFGSVVITNNNSEINEIIINALMEKGFNIKSKIHLNEQGFFKGETLLITREV